MLIKVANFFKHISENIVVSSKKIISNAGIIPIFNFVNSGSLIPLLLQVVKDNRDQLRIWYSCPEILLGMIFKLLDGDKRFYHFRNTINNDLFKHFFSIKEVPHRNTFRYFVMVNPLLYRCLSKVLFNFSLMQLKEEVKSGNLKRITIDIDQFARRIYGRQKGVKKGYHANKKNVKVYQVQPWSIRETGSLIALQLRPGNTHCVKYFLRYLKMIIPSLLELGVPITVIVDSGYEDERTMEFLDGHNVGFVFGQKQRKGVKTRGRNAKNKKEIKSTGVTYKERNKISKNKHIFREIFIQAKQCIDEYGQLYIKEFAPDKFTNVYITNLKVSAKTIYKYYKGHAIIEKLNEELKNDFGSGIAHNESMFYNLALSQITALAYNIKVYYLGYISNDDDIKKMKLSTLQSELIHIPGIISNSGNKLKMQLSKNGFRNYNKYIRKAA